LGKTKICAIGPKTAEALEEKGIIVEMIPEKFCAEAIIEKLGKKLKPGQKVLLPRADLARPILVTSLQGMGAEVEEVIAYRTTFASVDDTHIQKVIQNKGLDVITFTSSSTVQNFVSLLGKEQVGLLKDVTIACIGPITAETAASLGLKVDVTAVDYTIDGLVEALVDYFKK
jgi:uroporphyrinogen III methyltransferase/synthase